MLNRYKHFPILIALLFSMFSGIVRAEDEIPNPPNPPRLVNDFAGILSPDQVEALEQKLVAFNDTTSTQIAVVIVNSLGSYEPADFAQQLGKKWGVGGSKFNNGFVILVKPKIGNERGKAFIATGYGVEALVPDATAWDVVNNEMIPRFRENDYYGGINAAVNALFKFTSGEYKASTYKKNRKAKDTGGGIVLIIILIILIITFINRGRNNRNINRNSSSTMLWPFLFGAGSGNWGNFSGGSGGFGGGGGGFGGFGGGSFGGGGAGGSW